MDLYAHFVYCPQCGVAGFTHLERNHFHCKQCDLHLFLNAASGVGGIITDGEGKILFLRRSKNPGMGKLGLPGGFVDAGEGVDAGLIREVKEETNLDVVSLCYLCSFPNRYTFKDVNYDVVDLFFTCTVTSFDSLAALDEVDEWVFLAPSEINLNDIAFESVRRALGVFMRQIHAVRDGNKQI